MGRLTLNVLLSFAQFEREVTGERIRDKIAASKKKGLWRRHREFKRQATVEEVLGLGRQALTGFRNSNSRSRRPRWTAGRASTVSERSYPTTPLKLRSCAFGITNPTPLPVDRRPKGGGRVQKTFQQWGDDTVYRPWDRMTGPHNGNAVTVTRVSDVDEDQR